jgi:hypothetical protein
MTHTLCDLVTRRSTAVGNPVRCIEPDAHPVALSDAAEALGIPIELAQGARAQALRGSHRVRSNARCAPRRNAGCEGLGRVCRQGMDR